MYNLTRFSFVLLLLGMSVAQSAEPVRRRAPGRSHVLLRFDAPPQAEQVRELERRGARLLQPVAGSGFTASVDDGVDLDGLGLDWAGRLRPENKISAALARADDPTAARHVIAEFHPDVSREDALSIAAEQGFEVLDHPDILPGQTLLRGPVDRLMELAEWDEVAYIFPASDELAEGRRVHACAGAVAGLGTVGQYAGRLSEGWDGPGRGRVDLGYFFSRLTDKLPPEKTSAEILRAMSEWAKYASLSFNPAAAPDGPRTLNVLFAVGSHGDAYPFDGRSGALAHTYYPAPPNPEPIAGDMHFDESEEWVAGPDLTVYSIDLFSVVLHEIGHALGLTHSDFPGTVMYPYYRRAAALTPEDILRIQELYASPSTSPGDEGPFSVSFTSPAVFPVTTAADSISVSGNVTGGSGDVQLVWTSDRGPAGVALGGRSWNIAALPLQIGDNVITITATDAVEQRASRSVTITRSTGQMPLVVRIATPASGGVYTTTNSSVMLAGSAEPASAVARVEWSSSRGGRGLASGTDAWTAGPIALTSGSNVITVTAFDSTGRSASAWLEVNYSAGVTDTVAPSIVITSPATTSVLTRSAAVSLRGTAADNRGVARVIWETSTGKSGLASGTSSWSAAGIPLLIGMNRIVLRAVDAAGNTGWRSITVTRQ